MSSNFCFYNNKKHQVFMHVVVCFNLHDIVTEFVWFTKCVLTLKLGLCLLVFSVQENPVGGDW
jgi:hypothetical protein